MPLRRSKGDAKRPKSSPLVAAKTRFVASAVRQEQLPPLALPEVAVAGRSNVGKSSLLGMVLGHPQLVRTSRTPGRTQALNLFVFEDRLALVDLPGYGFAKVGKGKRSEMGTMIADYLRERSALAGVVLLVDARRTPVSPLDVQMAQLILDAGRPLLLVATKTDLVPKNRLLGELRRIETEIGAPSGTAIAVSAATGRGRAELVSSLFELVG